MSNMLVPTPIAIDGTAASGKTTLARGLAARFGYRVLDTGAMYRAFALAASEAGIPADDAEACVELARRLRMELKGEPEPAVWLDGEDVTARLREPRVEASVSAYSKPAGVREVMVARQRAYAEGGPAILVGRDIGTVVLPDAPVKLFLSASDEERARRRSAQSADWGQARSSDEAAQDIARRDSTDSARTVAPLKRAEDAAEIDTTSHSPEDVLQQAITLIEAARGEPAPPAAGQPDHGDRVGLSPSRFRTDLLVPFFYRGSTGLARFLLWVITRWSVQGRENLPARGPVILVSNHIANPDPLILGCAVTSRHIVFMSKIELFTFPLGLLVRGFGAFPVRRFDSDVGAMLSAMRVLRDGGVLGMFPEGTRSRTGRLSKMHPGTAMIALRTGATVVPCAITGTQRLYNPKVLLRRPRVSVTIGEPIAIQRLRRPGEHDVEALMDSIGAAISAMLPAAYRAHT